VHIFFYGFWHISQDTVTLCGISVDFDFPQNMKSRSFGRLKDFCQEVSAKKYIAEELPASKAHSFKTVRKYDVIVIIIISILYAAK